MIDFFFFFSLEDLSLSIHIKLKVNQVGLEIQVLSGFQFHSIFH